MTSARAKDDEITEEDAASFENKIRQELRTAGIQPGKQLELAFGDVFLAMLRALDPRPRH
jgi:hypothetical protein